MHYKIFSYEKCVCFLFLVILFILNCSGFRIDNLPLTDIISKKNSFAHTSSSISPLFSRFPSSTNSYSDKIFKMPQRSEYSMSHMGFAPLQNNPSSQPSTTQHKIRHHHRLMMHMKHSRHVTGHSAVIPSSENVTMSMLFSTTGDNTDIAIPHTMKNHLPLKNSISNNIQKRSFLKNVDSTTKRSYSHINKKRPLWKEKQNNDITWRAYKAEFVLHAEKIAQRNNSSDSPWIVRVVKSYKRQCKGQFELNVYSSTVQDQDRNLSNKQQRKYRQHHNEDKIGQHYLLFLNSQFESVASPKPIKSERFNDSNLKRVCMKNFRE